jgi:hypothetical protein
MVLIERPGAIGAGSTGIKSSGQRCQTQASVLGAVILVVVCKETQINPVGWFGAATKFRRASDGFLQPFVRDQALRMEFVPREYRAGSSRSSPQRNEFGGNKSMTGRPDLLFAWIKK